MMRLQRFTRYLLHHRWLTMVLVFMVTFIPIIGVIGILVAALVTLHRGILEGAWLTLIATLPYVISLMVSITHDPSVYWFSWVMTSLLILSNLFTWVFAALVYKRTHLSTLMQVAALLGVLAVSILHLAYPNVADWWGKQLQSSYTQVAQVTQVLKPSAVMSRQKVIKAVSVAKEYTSGFMIAAMLFSAFFQLIIARWWQVLVFTPGQLRGELQSIRMSHLAGLLFIASVVLSYWGNRVVLDIMPIVYILFAGAGLSLIHYLCGRMTVSTGWFWLVLIYLILIYSLPASLIVVTMLALFDAFLDIRRYLAKISPFH